MSKQKPSLLEEVRAERLVSGRPPTLTRIADSLSEQDRGELIEALADLSISAAAIARSLTRRGYKISPAAVQAYRRGEIVRGIA